MEYAPVEIVEISRLQWQQPMADALLPEGDTYRIRHTGRHVTSLMPVYENSAVSMTERDPEEKLKENSYQSRD